MEWSRDMSAGHRQRGPQEGHSTMEEGEEMRDEENEEWTRGGGEGEELNSMREERRWRWKKERGEWKDR